MIKLSVIIPVIAVFFFTSCNNSPKKQNDAIVKAASKAAADVNNDSIVYKTDNLILVKLSKHVYQHISFLNTHDFGRVECNGMLVVNNNEAIIFDTPTDTASSAELINYITKKLGAKITAIIPTHFHNDCVGGIEKFIEEHIPCYASNKTIKLLKNIQNKYTDSMKGFDDSLSLDIGGEKVYARYFGEGHTKDNITGYFAEDRVLFGGCLIKEQGATKGFLDDANVSAWPATVMRLKKYYPQTKIVIPGHGKPGGTELLDYTMALFR